MEKVWVFYFKSWDHAQGKMVQSKRAATQEAIVAALGVALIETAHEVDPSQLDDNGMVKVEADPYRG